MLYNSTINKSVKIESAQAIMQGISEDGGLFVPESFPRLDREMLSDFLKMDYKGRAKKILAMYLSDFSQEEISFCVDNAYTKEKFSGDNPAPIKECTFSGRKVNVLELWHGPTSAFKDMALQLLPYLLTTSLKKVGKGRSAVILTATSGDTGKAALEGFKNVDGTKIIVFYPQNGVSPMQKRQMTTQEGENVSVCAINGNFDDAQTGVKKIFTDNHIKEKLAKSNMIFSSANSINWGRLLAQVVYYVSAYCDLVNDGKISLGDKINIVVPTGNFGNILAAYYAYRMGLPVSKFICASNSNDVLTEFINTGVYNRKREFYTTASPSMDILVSSNLERFLYHITGENTEKVSDWMKQLKEIGKYTVDEKTKADIQSLFYGNSTNDEETKETICKLFKESNYLCDTHTAVAMNVYSKYANETGDETVTLLASTASPYKFCKTVFSAVNGNEEDCCDDEFLLLEKLSAKTETEIPTPIKALKDKVCRFDKTIETDKMPDFVTEFLGV